MADIPPLDSVYQYALNFLPQIKSAEYGIETQERYLAMQQGQRSPRIYARGLLYSNYSDGLDQSPGSRSLKSHNGLSHDGADQQ